MSAFKMLEETARRKKLQREMNHEPYVDPWSGVAENLALGIREAPGYMMEGFDMMKKLSPLAYAVEAIWPTETPSRAVVDELVNLGEVEQAFQELAPSFGATDELQALARFTGQMIDPLAIGGAGTDLARMAGRGIPRVLNELAEVSAPRMLQAGARGGPVFGVDDTIEGVTRYLDSDPEAAYRSALGMKAEQLFDPRGVDYDEIRRATGQWIGPGEPESPVFYGPGRRQRGMIAGPKSPLADHEKLAEARKLKEGGEDARTIYQKTGWWLDHPDGIPRFETDDSATELLPINPEQARWLVREPGAAGNEEPLGPISNILNAPGAYSAYPDLADIRARGTVGKGGSYRPPGSWPVKAEDGSDIVKEGVNLDVEQRKLAEGYDYKKPKWTGEVALHELQHGIQEREGMARGGSPSMAPRPKLVEPDEINFEGIAPVMEKYGIAGDDLGVDADGFLRRVLNEAAGKGATDSELKPIKAEIERVAEKNARDETLSMNEWYNRLSGEVEARSAARRRNLTAEQRRQFPFWDDSTPNLLPEFQGPDVPYSDQILVGPGGKDYDELQSLAMASSTAPDELLEIDELYQAGDITTQDLAEMLSNLESLPPSLERALNKYQVELYDDFRNLGGRGDYEQYEGDLLKAFDEALGFGNEMKSIVTGPEPGQVSTRFPTAITRTEDPLQHDLLINMAALEADPRLKNRMAKTIATQMPSKVDLRSSSDRMIDEWIDFSKNNLDFLMEEMDKLGPDVKARAAKWYDGAHKYAVETAQENGISNEAAAGVMAALSPNLDWFQNAEMARRLIKTWKTQQAKPWDSEMAATAKRIAGNNPNFEPYLERIKGKALQDVDDPADKGFWIRIYDETYNDKAYPELSPEGYNLGTFKTAKSGKPGTLSWTYPEMIKKAVQILEDPSLENISTRLGTKHKIRNFYNNILTPMSKRGEITADTHHGAGTFLLPIGGSSREISTMLGSAPASDIHGIQGTYPLHMEPAARLAKDEGLLGRQVQSITWEGSRNLFNNKSPKQLAAARRIWKEYEDGKISQSKAQELILELAGGVNLPSWVGKAPVTGGGK